MPASSEKQFSFISRVRVYDADAEKRKDRESKKDYSTLLSLALSAEENKKEPYRGQSVILRKGSFR